jgi:hypothetical protein
VAKNSSDSEIWEEWERLATGFKGSIEDLEELMHDELSDNPKKVRRQRRLQQEDRDVKFRSNED